MKRTIRIFGGPVEITFHAPTNEEYNTYSDAVGRAIKNKNDGEIVAVRVKQFDVWAETINGIDKTAIPDKIKSSTMFHVFELVEVDEKN